MGEVDEALRRIEYEKQIALGKVAGSYLRMAQAKREYEEHVLHADYLGIGPSEIARHAGVSETAIRLFIKRRKAKKK